jgi:hypothetical protein
MNQRILDASGQVDPKNSGVPESVTVVTIGIDNPLPAFLCVGGLGLHNADKKLTRLLEKPDPDIE